MNFIFINPDELRAESLGCYQHPLVQTPHIDRLAGEGTRFDQAHCQHPVCSPSRCSFMTGWYPHVRGHRTLGHLLQPEEPNLCKYMKQAEYEVVWIGKNDTLAQASFPASVDQVYSPGEGSSYGPNPYEREDPRYYSFVSKPYEGPLETHRDYARYSKAIEYLRGGPAQPFFMVLNTVFPHCPYGAPEPWHHMYDPDDLPPLRPVDGVNKPLHQQLIRRYRRLDQCDERDLRQVQAIYLGMISYVDHLVGRLLDALDETGLAETTTLVFFSDHGDYAGDYGLVEKWSSGLEDVLTRVPLIIRTPGGARGHVVWEPVELFDIFATTLQLAGVQAQHPHFARSLAPQLAGAPGDPARAVFAEGGYGAHEPHCYETRPDADPSQVYYPKYLQQEEHPESIDRCAMIRTKDAKLIWRSRGVSELYDLKRDPRELNNRYDAPGSEKTREHMIKRLLGWYVATSDIVPFAKDPRGV